MQGWAHYAPLFSVLVASALTFVLATGRAGFIVHDIPNERSLHDKPVPRTGGIALMVGVLCGWLLLVQSWAWWIMLPLLCLFALSLLDDVRGLSAKMRLTGHFIAALIAVAGAGVSLPWFVPVLLFVVWIPILAGLVCG